MLHRSTIATSVRLAVAALIAAGSLASDPFAQYAVGTSNVTFVDPARGNRSIPVDLYYPAQSAGAGQPVARGDAPSGIYFARLSGSGGTTVAKLVLVR